MVSINVPRQNTISTTIMCVENANGNIQNVNVQMFVIEEYASAVISTSNRKTNDNDWSYYKGTKDIFEEESNRYHYLKSVSLNYEDNIKNISDSGFYFIKI